MPAGDSFYPRVINVIVILSASCVLSEWFIHDLVAGCGLMLVFCWSVLYSAAVGLISSNVTNR